VTREPRPTLQGQRVRLRPGTEADLPALLAIRAEPSVARWWGAPDAADIHQQALGLDDEADQLVVDADGDVAGAIQYWQRHDVEFRHAGIDIFLGAAWQGRGLGREAIRLVIDYLFGALDHHRITIDPAAESEAAIRCYAGCGFRVVGTMRAYQLYADGAWHDGLLMELVRTDHRRPSPPIDG
jgi:aminoglycoside 6'-N-acetyltransferase